MKKVILTTFLALLVLAAGAQTATQAQQILDKTAKVVGNKSGATANFSMSGIYGKGSGSVSIKGNKFCAKTPQATIWFDGKTQWTYNPNTDEVNVTTPTEDQQQAMNPYKFINIYKNGFKMSSKNVAAGYQVHLTAQNQKRAIKEMYITINKQYQPTQIKVRNTKGWTVFNVSNFKAKKLSDASFRFNAKDYPQAEVIDLR